jgi:glucosamine kinase
MNRTLFLGVDGGATGCRARIADEAGTTLGEGEGGPANPRFGVAEAGASIGVAAEAALAAAGLPKAALGRLQAGLGLAGVGQARDRAAMLAWRHPFAALALATDAETACLGAHDGGDGGILVVGTGSCGMARVGTDWVRVGGWGFPISDQGSGAWLGLRAIRAALWAHDGIGAATPLTGAVMREFGGDPEAIVAWLAGARSRDYAALAPMVVTHAEGGDGIARELLAGAADEVAAMLGRLFGLGLARVCLMGGLAPVLAARLPQDLQGRLSAPLGDALDGALILARQAATA